MSLINSITRNLGLSKEDLVLITLLAKAGNIKGKILSTALWTEGDRARKLRSKKYKKLESLDIIKIEKDSHGDSLTLAEKGKFYLGLTGQKVVCSNLRNKKTEIHDDLTSYIAARLIHSKGKILGSIYFEEEVQRLKILKNYFPDLLVKNASGRYSVIEVELTQKENRRFLDKIEFYKNNMDFEHVFYICSTENLKSKFSDSSAFKKFSAYTVEELSANEEKIINKIAGIWDMSFYKGWS